MAAKPHIPQTFDALTPEWLTAKLRAGGYLADASVRSVKVEKLGLAEGFVGEVARLTLDLDRHVEGMPPTLIAKLPTPVVKNRKMGELLGAYEREILFYESFAAGLPLRTPAFYGADLDRTEGGGEDAEAAAKLDAAPMWFIRLFMPIVTWIVGMRRRRYLLLIEDLASGRTGDQIRGCSASEAAPVVRSIARVHAAWWSNEELAGRPFLRRLDLNPRTLHTLFRQHLKAFHRRYGARIDDEFRERLAWLDANAVAAYRSFDAPETLLHCDLRLDNIFFFPGSGEPGRRDEEQVAVFDWQLAGRGPGPYDLAYFLSSALPADTPPEDARQLVEIYAEELASQGVEGYDLAACLRDYQRGLLLVLHRIASTGSMEMGEERGPDLVWVWAERTLARLRGAELAALI